MKILVQKFGGTSVGAPEGLASLVEIVRRSAASNRVAVVVSAVSSKTKAEGTTSLLLEACRLASEGSAFHSALEKIHAQHNDLIARALRDPARREKIERFVGDRIEWTRSFLSAISVIRDLSPRSLDAVISIGEQLSAHVVAAVLEEGGVRAAACELSEAVPADIGELDQRALKNIAIHFAEICTPRNDFVPVVTGFFGPVPGGLLKRIGRGYSDFTAALLANGFGSDAAEELQIWKEVDGVYSTDPRRVPNAKVLPMLSAHEAAELTNFGSEVLHPFTMEQVMSVGLPIRVKNTHRPDGAGTMIVPTLPRAEKRATAVTAKGGVVVAMITSNRMYEARGFLAGVFGVMRDNDISVDLISTSEVSISFTVDDADALEKSRDRLEEFGDTTIVKDRAILSVVGEGLRGFTGAAGRLFTALGDNDINVEMISQGISETNISCVISERDVESAVKVVHRAFFE